MVRKKSRIMLIFRIVRKRFLNFVSEWGTQKDREEIFQENSRWLKFIPTLLK